MSYSKLLSRAPLASALAAFFLIAPVIGNAEQPAAPSAGVNPQTTTDKVIRIKAGLTELHRDELGMKWVPDEGFADGETTERPTLAISNTQTPSLYLSERFSMTKFSKRLPDGKYVVRLHFAETYEGIEGVGQRVFTFNVEGQEFKNFDVWMKAGGPLKAYVETVPVTITDGRLDITFTSQVENPMINALEILATD